MCTMGMSGSGMVDHTRCNERVFVSARSSLMGRD